MEFLKRIFPETSALPRWVIFFIDVTICAVSFVFATFLRYNFFIETAFSIDYLRPLPLVLAVRAIFMVFFHLSSGIVRHTTIQDAIRVFYTVTVSTTAIVLINVGFLELYENGTALIPLSIIILDYFGSIFLMSGFRVSVKILYLYITKPKILTFKNIAIYGSGDAAITAKRKIEQHGGGELKVVAFFDDDSKRNGKTLDNVMVYNPSKEFDTVLQKLEIVEIIISDQNINRAKKQNLIEHCLNYNIKVRNVPPIEKWINGELSYNQIKNVKIEDLIERDTIVLDKGAIAAQLKDKVVMVTGAAGSIGSEIVRQLIQFEPTQLILVDKSEVRLYEMDNELNSIPHLKTTKKVKLIVGDICNMERMEYLFKYYKPNILYHAAAFKHVPLMEDNPGEAVYTNVKGTKILADLSIKYDVDKFVFVSTDKAVNPTNVMGASKRIAEIYVQSLNNFLVETNAAHTRFITTRFGNVLGSSGSVIPRFRRQIEEGGPITVTHPDITRYFMTIPEACQLVLEAGNMGNGGEIYIFDMGNSIKIIDLAKKMVKLSGLTLGQDIQIAFTGLRPGEKINEELLADQENTLPTYHPKILIAQVRLYNFINVVKIIEDLINSYETQDDITIVSKMKQIVPEYKSNNSRFEKIDAQLSKTQINK